MEIDYENGSESEMEIDSGTALYLDTTDRLTRWRMYFDRLVQIARLMSTGASFTPQENTKSISVGEIYNALVVTEAQWPSVRRLEQRELADRYPIFELPPNVFYDFLDSIFGFDTSDVASSNPSILKSDVHILCTLEKSSPLAKRYIGEWIRSSYVKDGFDSYTRSFKNYKEAADEYSNVQSLYASSVDHTDMLWQVGIERGLRKGCHTVAYQCAASCADCLDFLIRHNLIHAEGYDGNGMSWLDAAIRSKNQSVFTYLLEKLRAEDFYNYTNVHHLSEKNVSFDAKQAVFRLIVRQNWAWACIHLLCAFIKGKKVKQLRAYIDGPTEQRIHRFLDQETAESLRKARYNLADTAFEAPADEQCVYHTAALHNPHGETYMKWLFDNGNVDIATRNFRGKNTLQIAATGNNPTSIQWLCQYIDPLEIWERPAEGRFLVNEYSGCALEIAARNMTNVSVFETMMNCVGDGAFEDFDLALSLFKAIFSGLHDFLERGPPTLQSVLDSATETAKSKCNVIKARLSEEWLESSELNDAMCALWRYGFSELAASIASFTNADRERQKARKEM